MSKKIISLFGLVSLLLTPAISEAFRFSPMVVEFEPTGSRSTQVLVIENPGDEKLPVQLEAFARSADSKGVEVRKKTEDFIIYPEQLVLLPKEKRNVRVTWVGDLRDGNEKAYRIVASQLPVDFRQENSAPKKATSVNLKVLFQYVASAYVTPKGAIAQVQMTEVKKVAPKKIAVTFQNTGSAHKVLIFNSLKIKAGDKSFMEISTHKGIESVNLLPGDKVTVDIETVDEVPSQKLTAEIVFKDLDN